MKVFVSGATGYIGIQLVKRLVEDGHTVHALYRSELKADLIRHPDVTLFKGDILDKSSLHRAIEDVRRHTIQQLLRGCGQRTPNWFTGSMWMVP